MRLFTQTKIHYSQKCVFCFKYYGSNSNFRIYLMLWAFNRFWSVKGVSSPQAESFEKFLYPETCSLSLILLSFWIFLYIIGLFIVIWIRGEIYIGRIWGEWSSQMGGDFLEDPWYLNFLEFGFGSDPCIIFISRLIIFLF